MEFKRCAYRSDRNYLLRQFSIVWQILGTRDLWQTNYHPVQCLCSTLSDAHYVGGSVHWGAILSILGRLAWSIFGGVQYTGGGGGGGEHWGCSIHWEYSIHWGLSWVHWGCSVHWGKPELILFWTTYSTEYPQCTQNSSHNQSREPSTHILPGDYQTAIRAEPVLSLYGDLCSYYPHIKFLGITFDNRMTFIKHFEEILERCNQKFHRLRILVNKKWGPSPTTILQIYKQCVRPIFAYGIIYTITVSESVINKIRRVQNSFIRLALRLPRYVSARLLHEASGLPYVRERLSTVGQNHLARVHVNPLVGHTVNSARINIAWDKYKRPISTLKPPDWSTDIDCRMQKMR